MSECINETESPLAAFRTADGHRMIDIPLGTTLYRAVSVGNACPAGGKLSQISYDNSGPMAALGSWTRQPEVQREWFLSKAAACRKMAADATAWAVQMMEQAARESASKS